MRIAILSDGIPPESSGGAQTIAWSLARGLLGMGHDIHVITVTRGEPFEEIRDGIATHHLRSAPPARWQQYASVYNPATIGPLRAALMRIRPDIVNAHNIQNDLSFFSLAVAHQLGIPTVWNSHDVSSISVTRLTHFIDSGNHDPNPPVDYRLPLFHDLRKARLRWNPLRLPLTHAIVRANTDIRVSVSQAHANALMANGLPTMRVVHNGIDVARFEQTRPEAVRALREKLGLGGRRVVLFAGRLRRDKGSVQLISAMDAVSRQIDDVALLVLANTGFRKHNRIRQAFPRVFEKHYVESGWLGGDDLAAAFQLADVIAAPSICLDSFPTVNLEAMAAGKPVVATCFGGSPEAVIDGETGYIINPFNTEQFAGRLAALLIDDALRLSMGAAGQRRAQELFSLERYVSSMLEVYREASG